jgi:hypothetical protein
MGARAREGEAERRKDFRMCNLFLVGRPNVELVGGLSLGSFDAVEVDDVLIPGRTKQDVGERAKLVNSVNSVKGVRGYCHLLLKVDLKSVTWIQVRRRVLLFDAEHRDPRELMRS